MVRSAPKERVIEPWGRPILRDASPERVEDARIRAGGDSPQDEADYRDGEMKLRSMLSGDGMNLRSNPGAIAVTGLTVMRGAPGGPVAS
jgi:hypothetical protein